MRWRVWLRWYAVALLLPTGLAVFATVLNVLVGAQPPTRMSWGGWIGIVLTFLLVLLIPGCGGTWEEPGWRG